MRRGLRLSLAALAALAAAGCGDFEARRERLFARAAAAERAGDPAGAARILESGLAADPRDVALRLALAAGWERRGEPGRARLALDALPADVPRDASYLRELARLVRLERRRAFELALEQRELGGAVRLWRQLAESEPDARRLLDALLVAALRRDAWSVLEQLEPELRRQPTPRASLALHRLLLSRGEWGRAEALERAFLVRHPGHPGRYGLVLARARRESRSGAPREGLRLAREAARLRPDRAGGFLEQAVALRALDRGGAARSALRTALLVDPSDPSAARLARELLPEAAPVSEHRFSLELR